jgi:hypothetical protein
VKTFIKQNIVAMFGIPEFITMDNAMVFIGGFALVNSTPCYARANGQAESTNKILKLNIQKTITNNSKKWHEF